MNNKIIIEKLITCFDLLDSKYKFDIQETIDFKELLNNLE